MKWIFALNDGAGEDLRDLARVAAWTALRVAPFEAHLLYQGAPCDFTVEMERLGVRVHFLESRFRAALRELGAKRGDPGLENATGTFLRFEIPRLAQEQGWNDEFIFYTDCDVMFLRDPMPFLQSLRPQFFAVAPEAFPDKPLHMNAGVMWVNIAGMRKMEADFEAWTRAHLEKCVDFSYDQGAFRSFFNPPHKLSWRLGIPNRVSYGYLSRWPTKSWKWDDLSPELNWKPYWGPHPDPVIVHFHGLKPNFSGQMPNSELPPIFRGMDTPFWRECTTRWQHFLAQARA